MSQMNTMRPPAPSSNIYTVLAIFACAILILGCVMLAKANLKMSGKSDAAAAWEVHKRK